MTIRFSDYDGPTGLWIATGKQILPLASPAGAVAFVGSAVQSGIGSAEDAAVAQSLVDAAFAAVACQSSRHR
jgi:hypothetical protein